MSTFRLLKGTSPQLRVLEQRQILHVACDRKTCRRGQWGIGGEFRTWETSHSVARRRPASVLIGEKAPRKTLLEALVRSLTGKQRVLFMRHSPKNTYRRGAWPEKNYGITPFCPTRSHIGDDVSTRLNNVEEQQIKKVSTRKTFAKWQTGLRWGNWGSKSVAAPRDIQVEQQSTSEGPAGGAWRISGRGRGWETARSRAAEELAPVYACQPRTTCLGFGNQILPSA